MEPFWIFIRQSSLCQGDLLPGCWISRFPADFFEIREEARVIQAEQADLIIITQSCDLEQAKTSLGSDVPRLVDSRFRASSDEFRTGKIGQSMGGLLEQCSQGPVPNASSPGLADGSHKRASRTPGRFSRHLQPSC
jgi:hypothetical protein